MSKNVMIVADHAEGDMTAQIIYSARQKIIREIASERGDYALHLRLYNRHNASILFLERSQRLS